jgi:hypothetical protein
VGSAHVHEGLS